MTATFRLIASILFPLILAQTPGPAPVTITGPGQAAPTLQVNSPAPTQVIQGDTTNWPYVVLGVVSVLFGANGAVMMWFKGRSDLIKRLSDRIDILQLKVTEQATQMGSLDGQVKLLTNQLDTVRKQNHYYRNLAHKYKLKWKDSAMELRRLKERYASLEDQIKEQPQ